MKEHFKKIFLATVAAFLAGAEFARAQTAGVTPPPGTSGGGTSVTLPNPIGATTAQGVINLVFPKLVLLAAPVVAIMVLWGGFQILSSRGDPEKFKDGRNTILYAAVGYGVILLAGGVTYIIQDLLSAGKP